LVSTRFKVSCSARPLGGAVNCNFPRRCQNSLVNSSTSTQARPDSLTVIKRRKLLVSAALGGGLGGWLGGTALPALAQDAASQGVADLAALVREMKAGAVVLMRHTQTTPGVGDPPGWRLNDCRSQRNLDATGVAHAQRIGRWFEQHQLSVSAVRNSPWCRTRDTAKLAFARSQDWPALANIFEDRSGADAQAAAAKRALFGVPPGELVVWVSHGVTIQHVLGDVGLVMGLGEAVVLRRGSTPDAPPRVLGRLWVP
jgi:phosphohistidine phosphatase SixA